MEYTFLFPEKDAFRAMEATKPDFDITVIPNWEQVLHVPLAEARGMKAFEKMEQQLGYFRGRFEKPSSFNKMLFSGHKGSGKTTELLQFAEQIEKKGKHIVVRLLLEGLRDLSQLEPEDVYMLCIGQLYATLQSLQIEGKNALPTKIIRIFDELAATFNTLEEVSTEITNQTKAGLESSASAKVSFWTFFNVESRASGSYTFDEKITKSVRERVKDNLSESMNKINIALSDLTQYLQEKKLASEILFVIDGFEKTLPHLYEHIFIKDTRFVTQLQAHVLCCIPIKTFYDVQKSPIGSIFQHYYLPMLRPKQATNTLLSEMVTRRADVDFFEPKVLHHIASYSGGSPRQMLILANKSILNAASNKTTLGDAKEAITEYGIDLLRTLTRAHRTIIESGNYMVADEDTLDLVYAGVLLEYNGENLERKLNPVLHKHFPNVPK